ncbi:MAG: ABC transporter substrate-binding protein [Candidatus Omnitrophica bacterium]|nr:ABC transporter substrate-binding protein [Candidatus Omnitrophota bacterium]
MSNVAAVKSIRFGHSPDPDDAFMFYAIAYEMIDMRGFKVEHVIEDIESLNQRALKQAELEVTAVSCHAYAFLADKYYVMRCGASIGDKYGPILIQRSAGSGQPAAQSAKNFLKAESRKLKASCKVAVPGKMTTAYLALQIYAKETGLNFEPVWIPFDQIFEAVQSGKADLGLVIHEGQITYEQNGFEKVLDLGTWWDEKYKLPLPLGIDAIRKDLGKETCESFTRVFKNSIVYALEHRKPALDYAIKYGRGIHEKLNDQFVGMYVNDLTVDLGRRGEEALLNLLCLGYEKGILPKLITPEFV